MKLTPVIALALVSALPLTGCVAQDDGNSNIVLYRIHLAQRFGHQLVGPVG